MVVLGILPKIVILKVPTKFPWILNNFCSKVVEFIIKEIIFYLLTSYLIKLSEGAQFLMTLNFSSYLHNVSNTRLIFGLY